MQKMLSGRAPLDSHVGGVQDVQSWLPGFHVSHAVCARMSFNSIWVSVPASTLRWAKKNQGKVGGWHSPRPKSETLLFGRSICFVLLFFCCFVVFFLVCCFFCFLLHNISIFLRSLTQNIQI